MLFLFHQKEAHLEWVLQVRVPLFTAIALVIVLLLAYFLPPRVRGGGRVAAAAITWVPKPNVEVWPVDPPPPVNFNKTAEQEYGDKEVKLPHWTPTLHTFQVPQNYTKANCTYCNTREYTFSYKGCCFYFTKKKHTWNGCFQACAELYPCTYFYGPTPDILGPHHAKKASSRRKFSRTRPVFPSYC